MDEKIFSRYRRNDIVQSKYCYEDSDVLINKFGIQDPTILSKLETDLSYQRLYELIETPINGRFGLTHI